jgi:hypothetical protein
MIQKHINCANFNHRRADAPVRFCPTCGEIVNVKLHVKKCPDEIHRKRLKEANTFCVDCGLNLKT